MGPWKNLFQLETIKLLALLLIILLSAGSSSKEQFMGHCKITGSNQTLESSQVSTVTSFLIPQKCLLKIKLYGTAN